MELFFIAGSTLIVVFALTVKNTIREQEEGSSYLLIALR